MSLHGQAPRLARTAEDGLGSPSKSSFPTENPSELIQSQEIRKPRKSQDARGGGRRLEQASRCRAGGTEHGLVARASAPRAPATGAPASRARATRGAPTAPPGLATSAQTENSMKILIRTRLPAVSSENRRRFLPYSYHIRSTCLVLKKSEGGSGGRQPRRKRVPVKSY